MQQRHTYLLLVVGCASLSPICATFESPHDIFTEKELTVSKTLQLIRQLNNLIKNGKAIMINEWADVLHQCIQLRHSSLTRVENCTNEELLAQSKLVGADFRKAGFRCIGDFVDHYTRNYFNMCRPMKDLEVKHELAAISPSRMQGLARMFNQVAGSLRTPRPFSYNTVEKFANLPANVLVKGLLKFIRLETKLGQQWRHPKRDRSWIYGEFDRHVASLCEPFRGKLGELVSIYEVHLRKGMPAHSDATVWHWVTHGRLCRQIINQQDSIKKAIFRAYKGPIKH